jgi:hypothetical protein
MTKKIFEPLSDNTTSSLFIRPLSLISMHFLSEEAPLEFCLSSWWGDCYSRNAAMTSAVGFVDDQSIGNILEDTDFSWR